MEIGVLETQASDLRSLGRLAIALGARPARRYGSDCKERIWDEYTTYAIHSRQCGAVNPLQMRSWGAVSVVFQQSQ
jgi:hypothetical protein